MRTGSVATCPTPVDNAWFTGMPTELLAVLRGLQHPHGRGDTPVLLPAHGGPLQLTADQQWRVAPGHLQRGSTPPEPGDPHPDRAPYQDQQPLPGDPHQNLTPTRTRTPRRDQGPPPGLGLEHPGQSGAAQTHLTQAP